MPKLNKALKTVSLILFVCLVLIQHSIAQKTATSLPNTGYWNLREVSIINLIANPKDYQDEAVLVKGYLNLEYEGERIYLHKDDFEYGITENAVRITLSESAALSHPLRFYSKKYVSIRGVFKMVNGGTIENIDTIDVIERDSLRLPPKVKPTKPFLPKRQH